jgi:plasmid maintenance system killer protein
MRQLYVLWILLLGMGLVLGNEASGQLLIKGTVFDSTKINGVENVTVGNMAGQKTKTDSLGRYSIWVMQQDSLSFTYKNKSTLRFAVKDIPDFQNFDIALLIVVPSKYKSIKEVTVFSKSHQQDSLENREKYAKIFNYQKPGVKTSMVNGAVGADVNELINVFRFRRNKYLKKFQLRLEQQEKDRYINYRFSKRTVQQLTQLNSAALDSFMVIFRPSYAFTAGSSLYDFYWYIKMCGEQYKMGVRKNEFEKQMGWWKEEDN